MNIEETLDAVGEFLKGLVGLGGIGVVVEKQQDVDAEMAKVQSRCKGCVITVGEIKNRRKRGVKGAVELRFGVSVYTPKAGGSGAKRGGVLRSVILKALDGLDELAGQTIYGEVEYEDGLIADEENRNRQVFLVHAMAFKVPAYYL